MTQGESQGGCKHYFTAFADNCLWADGITAAKITVVSTPDTPMEYDSRVEASLSRGLQEIVSPIMQGILD